MKTVSYLSKLGLWFLLFSFVASPASAQFFQIEQKIDFAPSNIESTAPQLAVTGDGYAYTVWRDERDLSGVYFNYSHDAGNTWQPADIFIALTASTFDRELRISADDSGHVYVGWIAMVAGERRAVVGVSADHGQTWTTQVLALGPGGFWLQGMDLAANSNGRVCVVANSGQAFPTYIYSNCSQDFGGTWGATHTQVNSNTPTVSEVQHSARVCMDNNNHVYAAWIDGRDGASGGWRHTYFSVSNDGGVTWSTDVRLQSVSFAKGASDPVMDCDDAGRVHVVWHDFDGQNMQDSTYYNSSSDFGASWSNFKDLSNNAHSPQIRLAADNLVHITWMDNTNSVYQKIRYTRSTDNGATFEPSFLLNNVHNTESNHYHLAATGEFVAVIWENKVPDQGVYFDFSNNSGATFQNTDFRVDVNSGVDGKIPRIGVYSSGLVAAVWEDDRSTSNGNIYANSGDIGGAVAMYQDFEPVNGSDQYGWAFGGASVELSTEQVHGGTRAWKMTAPVQSGGTGIQSQRQRWDMDFRPAEHDRLGFWIWADPSNQGPNTVQVKFFDNGTYFTNGFEIWSTEQAQPNQWTYVEILFSQLPSDFDLTSINKLEFLNFWDGTYYIDDIQILLKDRQYQTFEECPTAGDCGWAWNGSVELETGIVFEGASSWKLTTTQQLGGTGLRSQERAYDSTEPDNQSYWHVDLNPAQNTHLTFWVYQLADNGLANNVGVQFFDHGNYFVNPAVIWTTDRAHYGEWTKITLPLSSLPGDLNVDDLNKIQFQVFWPGTYYFDDIRATQETPVLDETVLSAGQVQWAPVIGADLYEVQQATEESGPWTTLYEGAVENFTTTALNPLLLRARWKKVAGPLVPNPYASDWQAPVEYLPPLVTVRSAELKNNDIAWNAIPQAGEYQLESYTGPSGPWTQIHEGAPVVLSGQAVNGEYYRARAIHRQGAIVTETGEWGPAITFDPADYITAVGQSLYTGGGSGVATRLEGVNLGNVLLIEPEFVGVGGTFTPGTPMDDDDYSIREQLTARFGNDNLLDIYQDNYLQLADFDYLVRLGMNFVRLPIYYQVVEDTSGQFTQFDFIDAVIAACADRGLRVLLDLHGAPGAQSDELHSGRANYNRLFEDSTQGAAYRAQTIAFWQEVAMRYQNEPAVAGYDLINEPFGAVDHDPTFQAPYGLWTLYNDLYQAIRAIDANHLISMDSVPSEFDWATLPDPAVYSWTNVLY
ncbi:MAG: cellulase family glycosylhydrolase, partial [Candidatus Omnitrophica bacterium]|nr:cellulase family glycosylhydrolase [Candidatus Omnitrophota bacterium]